MRHIPAATMFTMVSFNLLVLFFPLAVLALWRRPEMWVRLLAVFLGMLTGLIDLRTDDAQLPVLLLLVFGFFAGFAQPTRAWISALLLAMWIPAVTVAALLAGVIRGKPFGVPLTMLAFIPAFVGAYLGVLVQRLGVNRASPLS